MLTPHALDIAYHCLTKFHICRHLISFRQVKLRIGLRNYKQKSTSQGSTDRHPLAHLTPILQNSRKKRFISMGWTALIQVQSRSLRNYIVLTIIFIIPFIAGRLPHGNGIH